MKKRHLETIKRGIARIFMVDQLTGKKSEPERGAKYRVTCYIPDQNGKTKKINRFTETYQDALKLRNAVVLNTDMYLQVRTIKIY